MDELRSKWYSSLPCSRSAHDAYRPQPLGVSAVAGVFILLGFGILGGCLILVLEHLVYKFALPVLRRQHKGTIWRSPNMMFFSQVILNQFLKKEMKSFRLKTIEWNFCHLITRPKN
jgi:ionotropic glutamate receptor NMDA 3A